MYVYFHFFLFLFRFCSFKWFIFFLFLPEKIRLSKPPEFENDLNLHSYGTNELYATNGMQFDKNVVTIPTKMQKFPIKREKNANLMEVVSMRRMTMAESMAQSAIFNDSWLESKEFGERFAFHFIYENIVFYFSIEALHSRLNRFTNWVRIGMVLQ